MGEERWRQLRDLFDAVCDLPPETWDEELARRTRDPALIRETLELLRSQTVALERARAPLDGLLARMAAPELKPGDMLGPWRLGERLGAGGMGVVYRAERADGLYERKVAVKLLHGLPDARSAERLAAERRILAGLRHPNIAHLYDGGTTAAGFPYLVMELVEGQPLDAWCRTRKPGLRERLQLFLRICRAVQAAHAHLVVHCDLKPGNVLVRADGEPVLLDFGIARLADAVEGDRSAFCTPAYAAPESLDGGPVGVASDVFSLGVILTELLACRTVGRQAGDRHVPVPPPSRLAGRDCPWRARLRGDLDAIAARACALAPDGRYGSVEAFADDLQRHLECRPVLARQGGALYRLSRALRRHWQAAAVTTLVVGLVAGFVWRLGEARDRAEREARVAEQVGQFMLGVFEASDPRRTGRGGDEVSVRELLDAGAARIAALADTPEVHARVQQLMGQAYANIGQPARAEQLLREAAGALQSPQVRQPVRAAAALNDLPTLLANEGRGREAEEAARRSLALLEAAGEQGVVAARAWNSLGLALVELERLDEAEAAFRRSLEMRRDLPDYGRHRSRILHNLGLLYRQRGDLQRSEAVLREALAGKLEFDGEHSYEVWITRHTLAVALTSRGRLREARALQQANLELGLHLFGEASTNTALTYGELASLTQDLGELETAARHCRRAMAIVVAAQGEDNAIYMRLLGNLGTLEEWRGDTARAGEAYRRTLEFRRRTLGEDHSGTLTTAGNLARLLMRAGRLDEAGPLVAHALRVHSARLEQGAPARVWAQMSWAEWLLHSGRHDAARAMLEEVAPHLPELAPYYTLRHLELQAEHARARGRVAEAAVAWRRAVEMAEAEYGPDAFMVARLRVPLAEALLAARRLERLESRLRAGKRPAGLAPQREAGGPGCRQTSSEARSPLVSSHALRSAARFLASSMSIRAWVCSGSSTVSCTRRRVSGWMVDSRSCCGFISPRPLKRVTLTCPLIFSRSIFSSSRRFSSSSRA
ncbi:hypothetical protein CR938_05560 [Pseudoxanthomonas taiwanensis]|uniref:Protein kinase domain-containing protein n=1 Tax=Pseudoxanthomonas taiwanensis TaxID=176598 RepID=A0A921NTK1_9GAMM|nr:hypothetical protein CR938_05560 [Pseudoxanthomonas taiwanensis]